MKNKNQSISFWDNADFPVAVAHRGGNAAGAEKENSLKAFQAAYDLGYRWFETDVVPTNDGVLLAIHGRGLGKQPNKDLPTRLKIQKMSYAQAKKKLIIGGERPLTLKELLDAFPDTKIFIDPKTYKAAPVLADFLISRPGDLSRVCIGSFHARNTRTISRRIKKVTGMGVNGAAIGKFRGLLLILSASLSLLEPMLKVYAERTTTKTFQLPYKQLKGAKGRKIIKLAHKNHLKVAVYIPNDRHSIEASIAAGADAIISDNVGLLKKYLKP